MEEPIRTLRRTAIGLAFVMVAVACGESSDVTTTQAPGVSTTIATSTTTTLATTTTTSTVVDIQATIDWVVDLLNGEDISAADYDERFSDAFRQQVPFESGFVPVLDEFRPHGPYTVVSREGELQEGTAIVESETGDRALITTGVDDDGQISTLLFQPADAPSLEDPPTSINDAQVRLGEIGSLAMLSAEIEDGACVAIAATDPDTPMPLGSVFKLYVLAALGEAVIAGDISWDDQLVIREDLKSIPTGVLQDRPDGDTVSVLEAAELMISISDNTATDHLMNLVGRAAVESAMVDYGNSNPELNLPFMNTRELAALKVGPASGLRVQWIDGDEEGRRAILTQISDITPADIPVQEWVEPEDPDHVEWFATPNDLCQLAVALSELDEQVPEVGEILSMNPGVPADPGAWDQLWFKGGSEPGLAATWFVTQSNGRTFVTTGSVVDPSGAIDTDEAILLFAAARDLLEP